MVNDSREPVSEIREAGHSRYAAIFAGGTMFSRILGLARDYTWVTLIPTLSIDAFIVAFRFPNMVRDLIGEGAGNAAFVPVFSETMEKGGDGEFRRLVSASMSAMLVILATLTVVGVFLVPYVVRALRILEPLTPADPVSEERMDLMITLSMWTFPYLFLIGMAVFAMGPLFSLRHYSTPSWSPALLNIAIIASCLLFRNAFREPAFALVLGVWLGGIAQVMVQYVALARVAGVWRPNFELSHPGVRAIFVLLIPVLLGQSAGELNKLIDTLFAASLEQGTVRDLFLANRLVQLPLSIFGVATSVAILPTLSRLAARDDYAALKVSLVGGFRQSFFLVFPATIGLMALGEPIIRLLFEYGEFTGEATRRTSTALIYYAAGLLSFAWVKVAVSGFYAIKVTRTPVLIASASMLLNIVLNAVLVGPLGYRGLALATTIAFTVNFLLLYVFLSRRYGPLLDRAFLSGLGRMMLAALLMGALAYGLAALVTGTMGTTRVPARILSVFAPLGAAIGFYFSLCYALRLPESRYILAALTHGRR